MKSTYKISFTISGIGRAPTTPLSDAVFGFASAQIRQGRMVSLEILDEIFYREINVELTAEKPGCSFDTGVTVDCVGPRDGFMKL